MPDTLLQLCVSDRDYPLHTTSPHHVPKKLVPGSATCMRGSHLRDLARQAFHYMLTCPGTVQGGTSKRNGNVCEAIPENWDIVALEACRCGLAGAIAGGKWAAKGDGVCSPEIGRDAILSEIMGSVAWRSCAVLWRDRRSCNGVMVGVRSSYLTPTATWWLKERCR